MSLKKRDLEIVYSLRWKNRTKREDSKELSVVVVYDIPSTTLNFEVFKNYLLKNSGTPEEDVRVYFIMDNGKEYPIQSQTDFQVALYAFRRKARAGEVINLLLERVSEQPTHKNLRHSNDVETQFDNVEPNSIISTCCNAGTPPEWFISGLAQLKKEIKDEITANVSTIIASAIADLKSPSVSAPLQHTACPYRVRTKPHKLPRKLTPHLVETVSDSKVFLKSMKLENKLEKLERKASKYREKRLALQHGQKSSDNGPKSSDSEAGPSGSKSRSRDKEEKCSIEDQKRNPDEQSKSEAPKMDGRPVNAQRSVPHMLGGEIYLHQWEVQNTGEAQWTSMTQLHYTWGSKKLVPLERTLVVPHLKPGEIGTISLRLHVPTHPGTYECYWQFMHKGRRFGHWLGVQLIVDNFDLKGHSSVLEKSGPQAYNSIYPKQIHDDYQAALLQTIQKCQLNTMQEAKLNPLAQQEQNKSSSYDVAFELEKMRLEDASRSELLHRIIHDIDSDGSWDSEPTHLCRKLNENSEYVMVPPMHQNYGLDTPDSSDSNQIKTPLKQDTLIESAASTSGLQDLKAKVDAPENFDDNNNTDSISRSSENSIKFRDEELDNIVIITVPQDGQVREGFIYVHVDGQKMLVPKNILKSELLTAAQEFETYLSANKSSGVVIDASETLNKSPTPSLASTIINQDTEQKEGSKEKTEGENILDNPPFAQQAVDLSVAARDNLDNPVDEAMDRSNYFEANNFMSHCSAAGSCYSEVNASAERQTRMFVFPQDVPGYEVVYPVLDINSEEANLTTGSFMAQPHPPIANSNEQISHPLEAVPNYQQTPLEFRTGSVEQTVEPQATGREDSVEVNAFGHPIHQHTPVDIDHDRHGAENRSIPTPSAPQVHNLPEGLVNGAVSAAINTARTVFNMIRPQTPGRWVNGHWISSSSETPREANLQALAEMGFWNRDLNATLLARFSDDLNRVVAELVQ